MSVIPIYLERRFEQRWASRFGSLAVPGASKKMWTKPPIASKSAGSTAAKIKEKTADLAGVGLLRS
jgi:hypothetical protein